MIQQTSRGKHFDSGTIRLRYHDPALTNFQPRSGTNVSTLHARVTKRNFLQHTTVILVPRYSSFKKYSLVTNDMHS